MDVFEIHGKRERSDLKMAAKIVGINPKNASAALTRSGSKYHNQVIKALATIITAREALLPGKETCNG